MHKHFSAFAGTDGFGLAFQRVFPDSEMVGYSEIDKYAIMNHEYNFKGVKNYGSITDIRGDELPDFDFFTFGWPCQDNSIAGKRKGQKAGTRSGLLFEAVRIIGIKKPLYFIAENVPGLLSVNSGVDFVEAVRLLSFLNESLPQYNVEMQLCNTRWLLPQNRERLYFVGSLRKFSRSEVFPIGTDAEAFSERPGEIQQIAQCLTRRMFANFKGNFIQNELKPLFDTQQNSHSHRVWDINGISQTLSAQGGGWGAKTGLYAVGYTRRADETGKVIRENYIKNTFGSVKTVTGGNQSDFVLQNTSIRRLTPTECERLQGFSDSWTKYGLDSGKVVELSDTQRYKLCGNAVSVPIVEMILNKIKNS